MPSKPNLFFMRKMQRVIAIRIVKPHHRSQGGVRAGGNSAE